MLVIAQISDFITFYSICDTLNFFPVEQVFFREHKRGLYPLLSHFTATSWPMYFLRAVTSLLFTAIIVKELDLPDSTSKITMLVW